MLKHHPKTNKVTVLVCRSLSHTLIIQLWWHTMLSKTRSVTFGGVSRGNMSSAVTSMADAGFGMSASVEGWAGDDVAGGLCLLLVVGIMIGVRSSSSSSRMELVLTQQPDTYCCCRHQISKSISKVQGSKRNTTSSINYQTEMFSAADLKCP